MPITAFQDKLVKKLDLLVGGRDTLAVDIVGARILGYQIDEVPHLRLAFERGLGEGDSTKISYLERTWSKIAKELTGTLLANFLTTSGS